MRLGVQKIADGLWQGALAHVALWACAAEHTDVAVFMVDPGVFAPPGVDRIVFPIDDNADGCDCFAAVRALAKQVAQRRVLTVCHMGENRSGLLSALILVERGMSPKNAVALVQANGSHNSPTQPHSFWNPGFVRQVLALEAKA